MCGGRGSRLDDETEKPLFPLGGRPMVDRVCDALDESRAGTVYAVTSPAAPRTREHLAGGGVRIVDAPGDGYVADLRYALSRVDPPVLTVAADLPLLAGDAVDAVLDECGNSSLAVCVPAALPRRLGLVVDTSFDRDGTELAPAGINVVAGDGEALFVTCDRRLAVNVNRRADARIAERML
jgi:adenosylcobinamide-phosphate guanylyltransferase